jgi:hypothetical protein
MSTGNWFKVGELARSSCGSLVEVIYVYDDFLHYQVCETGIIFVDRHRRTLDKLSPLEVLATVGESE